MTLTEQNLVAGHASFHNKCRPALSNKRTAELTVLGTKPVLNDEQTNQADIDAWNAKQARINRATSIMKNAGRMEANDFYASVMSELVNTNAISLTGVTDENLADKVATISDQVITAAVEAVYNRF
ncbi:hypothetical protein [Roseivirga sp. UBA838]|uniref:hypothetical protein n=1 Tax=Roseivirga sp. UBA838 TaxID=1947393 RepID=UPI00257DD879|nr:hypothetical protein [Roseivirga sp. UBA838]|tara:strand:+ start:3091 stop:3468 length:378 start_codon:yes stop_codon:yes gene_type:complete